MSRSLGRALLWCGMAHAVLLLGACGTDDIVVARLPPPAGEPGDAPDCASNDDCPPIAFCARERCSDAQGVCQLRPFMCEPLGPPSCGCDGVSYWNDCLREQYGATASTPGSCERGAATCTDENALDCPVLGAACARILPPNAPCEEEVLGACWILPVECPMGISPDRWMISCDDRMDCRDPCGAIRTGHPFHPDIMHQCPSDFPGR